MSAISALFLNRSIAPSININRPHFAVTTTRDMGDLQALSRSTSSDTQRQVSPGCFFAASCLLELLVAHVPLEIKTVFKPCYTVIR